MDKQTIQIIGIVLSLIAIVLSLASVWISEMTERRLKRMREDDELRAAAKYEYRLDSDCNPVKIPANEAALITMDEAELIIAIDYLREQDKWEA